MKPFLFQEAVSAEGLGEVPFLSFTRLRDGRSTMKPIMRAAAVGKKPPHPLGLEGEVTRCLCRLKRNLLLWF